MIIRKTNKDKATKTTVTMAPEAVPATVNPVATLVTPKETRKEINLAKLLNVDLPNVQALEGFPLHDITDIPDIDKRYVFDDKTTRQILLYLMKPLGDCLWISGDPGCGKTTSLLQIAARLGWGVQQITASNKCESLDLIGHTTLIDGRLVYEYGPLAKAMKQGEILLINEVDTMSSQDLSALNDVLEGKPLTIIQNGGEIIKPHPYFRVVVTANTFGSGDPSGKYIGTRVLNQAFLDRFRFLKVTYPTLDRLKDIINSYVKLPNDQLTKVLKLTEDLQRLHSGETAELTAPFSVRSVIKIANLLQDMQPDEAVMCAYAQRLTDDEQAFVMRLVKDIWGYEDSKTPVDKADDKPATPTKRRKAA